MQMAQGLGNYSGFGSFSMRNLYPNYVGVSQTEETVPDDSDQASLDIQANAQATADVDQKTTRGFWVMLIAAVVLLVWFGFSSR